MNGITHKQAQRYLRMDLDGLLTEAQRRDLETHLRACEACRADSASLAALTRRLQTGFHARWDAQHGPSENVMKHIHSQLRRIVMQKRIDFAFNILGGVGTLLVLFFVINTVISQFQKKSSTVNGTQTNVPASASQAEHLLAFASENAGASNFERNLDIYTMSIDGSDVTNITNNPANDSDPFWSPDGQRIAFMSDRNGNSDIFVMNPDGSGLTQLTDDPGYDNFFSWSPDGKKIIYGSNIDNDPNTEDGQLFIMNNDGSNKTTPTNEPGSYYFIGWSPDSQRVVFVKQQPNPDVKVEDAGIYVMDADGTNQHEWSISNGLFGIHWEDAQHFYGTVLDNTSYDHSVWSIYRFNVNGEAPQIIASHSAPGAWVHGIFDKTYIVESNNAIRWYSLDGSRTSLATWDFSTKCEQSDPGSITSHVISPDEKLAFVTIYCPNGIPSFYLENADGSTIKQLTGATIADSQQVLDTSWSSDGKYLLLTVGHRVGGYMDLYLLDIEQMLKDPVTEPVKLTPDEAWRYGYQATLQPKP